MNSQPAEAGAAIEELGEVLATLLFTTGEAHIGVSDLVFQGGIDDFVLTVTRCLAAILHSVPRTLMDEMLTALKATEASQVAAGALAGAVSLSPASTRRYKLAV